QEHLFAVSLERLTKITLPRQMRSMPGRSSCSDSPAAQGRRINFAIPTQCGGSNTDFTPATIGRLAAAQRLPTVSVGNVSRFRERTIPESTVSTRRLDK